MSPPVEPKPEPRGKCCPAHVMASNRAERRHADRACRLYRRVLAEERAAKTETLAAQVEPDSSVAV